MFTRGLRNSIHYWWTFWAVFAVAASSAVLDPYLGYRSVGFIFLIGVLCVGFMAPLGPVLFAAVLSTLTWNFFFIPPRFTFAISQPEDLIMCICFFVAALITGISTMRSRRHQMVAVEREERSQFLFDVLRDISEMEEPRQYISRVAWRIEELLGGKCLILMRHQLSLQDENPRTLRLELHGQRETFGVLTYISADGEPSVEQMTLLESVAQQLGLALERHQNELRLREARRLEESERLHQVLLSSISHEIRTPLTAIMGAASALEDKNSPDSEEFRRAVVAGLTQATDRLNRVVGNLLDMTRISSGVLTLQREWHQLEDLIGVVVNNLRSHLKSHVLDIQVSEGLPLVEIDFRLFEHVLVNLLLNAVAYSPAGSTITVAAHQLKGQLVLEVADRGAGIPPESLGKVFDKFYRVPGTAPGGTGLGLSIAKSIVELHQGQIHAARRSGGGTTIYIHLPIGFAPQAPREDLLG